MKILQHIRFFFCIALVIAVSACAIQPVATEASLIPGKYKVPPETDGQTYLLIYNNANMITHGLDMTARVNVSLNGKGVATLNIAQYVQLVLPNGSYQLNLAHKDMFDFNSSHTLLLEGKPLYVEVWPTLTSQSIKVHMAFPTGSAFPPAFTPYRPN